MNKKYYHTITAILFNSLILRILIQTINCTRVQKVYDFI